LLCSKHMAPAGINGDTKMERQFSAEDFDASAFTLFDRIHGKIRSSKLNAYAGTPGACTKTGSTSGANGATKSFATISGTPACKLVFTNQQYDNGYIVAHLARYSGSNKKRILTSDPERNWLSGHWNSHSSVCYHDRT